MSTTQWILSLSLLGWALLRNLGTRPVNRMTFLLPLVIVGGVGGFFLFPLPTRGNDLVLIAAGAAVGALVGIIAALATRVTTVGGHVHLRSGWLFAAAWVGLIAGRVAFATWATSSGSATVGRFSMEHQITGADAWTAAFVAMALMTVLVRTVWVALATARTRRTAPQLVTAAA